MMLAMLILVIVAVLFVGQGIAMHAAVPRAEAQFHSELESYYSQSKSVRDAAPTDSELANQFVRIQKAPSMLMEMKLVGVGKMLSGIALLLLAILLALMRMPMRLSMIMKSKK